MTGPRLGAEGLCSGLGLGGAWESMRAKMPGRPDVPISCDLHTGKTKRQCNLVQAH